MTTLDELLVKRGLGRFEAAKKIGISATTLRELCCGSFRKPWFSTVAKIADGLGVDAQLVLEAISNSRLSLQGSRDATRQRRSARKRQRLARAR